jgi:hypothetical protein
MDRIYDRWPPEVGVNPLGERRAVADRARPIVPFTGYPSLYGRFRGSLRPAALAPPANTLLLNAYTRPQSPVRAGEVVHGAQSLMNLRGGPAAGRDLYASLDGNVYQRRDNGWFRRQPGGAWSYVAPLKGSVQSVNPPVAGQARPGVRVAKGTLAPAAPNRSGDRPERFERNVPPNAGSEISPDVANRLEREYYARALSQMRAQGGGGRRVGGGRRR